MILMHTQWWDLTFISYEGSSMNHKIRCEDNWILTKQRKVYLGDRLDMFWRTKRLEVLSILFSFFQIVPSAVRDLETAIAFLHLLSIGVRSQCSSRYWSGTSCNVGLLHLVQPALYSVDY